MNKGMNLEYLFPRKDGIDYSKLKVTEEGLYSITKRKDAQQFMKIIQSEIPNLKHMTVTDATACIGGDTLNFAKYVEHVYSIEMNKTNFSALKNNVQVYGYKNITLYNKDSVKFFNWKTDVLFVDAPWGGPSYKSEHQLDLFLSNTRLDTWIQKILKRKNRPSYILLKLPANYNFQRLKDLDGTTKVHLHPIRSYVIVLIQ